MRQLTLWMMLAACLPQHPVWGQVLSECLPQGKRVAIRGALTPVDEGGYWQWIALQPVRPICTLADPADPWSSPTPHAARIQINTEREDIRSRLARLVGNKVEVTGELTQWHTGYQRTEVAFDVVMVRPIDARGEAALVTPVPPKPRLRDVAAYVVSIDAGRSLTKEAREIGTNTLLTPVADYAPHWVTGGEVVYIHCRDGYDVHFVNGSIREGDAQCGLIGNSCAFPIPERGTIRLKMQCTKVASQR